jgi:AraC family transcriptional regulator
VSVQLPVGHLYGENLKSLRTDNFSLMERFYLPRFATPKHSHKRALWCFVLEGGYTETFGGRTRECGSSTLLFHPPGEQHAEHFHAAGGRSFIVEIEPAWLERVRECHAVPEGSADYSGGALELPARRLYKEFAALGDASPLVIEGLMLEIMGEATRRRAPGAGQRPPAWLRQAKELLHARFTESLRLSEVADEVGVHPVHLAQMFHKSYRCTVGDYVRRLRVEYACRELATSGKPLVEIALAAGFCDQSHFNRTFKRLTGVAPSLYRDSLRVA